MRPEWKPLRRLKPETRFVRPEKGKVVGPESNGVAVVIERTLQGKVRSYYEVWGGYVRVVLA